MNNKQCTLLDCTNTEILMYCIYLQYMPSVRYHLHPLFWYRHTYMTFPAPCTAPCTAPITCAIVKIAGKNEDNT